MCLGARVDLHVEGERPRSPSFPHILLVLINLKSESERPSFPSSEKRTEKVEMNVQGERVSRWPFNINLQMERKVFVLI